MSRINRVEVANGAVVGPVDWIGEKQCTPLIRIGICRAGTIGLTGDYATGPGQIDGRVAFDRTLAVNESVAKVTGCDNPVVPYLSLQADVPLMYVRRSELELIV